MKNRILIFWGLSITSLTFNILRIYVQRIGHIYPARCVYIANILDIYTQQTPITYTKVEDLIYFFSITTKLENISLPLSQEIIT